MYPEVWHVDKPKLSVRLKVLLRVDLSVHAVHICLRSLKWNPKQSKLFYQLNVSHAFGVWGHNEFQTRVREMRRWREREVNCPHCLLKCLHAKVSFLYVLMYLLDETAEVWPVPLLYRAGRSSGYSEDNVGVMWSGPFHGSEWPGPSVCLGSRWRGPTWFGDCRGGSSNPKVM